MIRAKHCTESNNRLLITTIQITILQVFNLYLSNIKEKKQTMNTICSHLDH